MRIRIGTRGSDLALWQANHVADGLRARGAECSLHVLATRGDRIDDVPLTAVEGKAFFTAEIEEALLDRRVDLAVHSHKDLAIEGPAGLVIAAVPRRADPGERLLIQPSFHDPGGAFLPLVDGARVGTSAPRRAEQLLALRPDLHVLDLRGNVPTRVRRLEEERYDAIVLAAAGLDRLGLELGSLVCVPLPTDLLVPAPAQGALAVQVRAEDRELFELCRGALHDPETARAVTAERGLLLALGGGCNLPLGATVARAGPGFTAHAFLGADLPTPGRRSRWSTGRGEDPERAAAAAHDALVSEEPTGTGPLSGARVALTGAGVEGSALLERLVGLGADVRPEVVLQVESMEVDDVASRLEELRPGDALAVTSRRAVERLVDALAPKSARDAVAPGVVVAAVGSSTARALAELGLEPAVVGRSGARELAEGLALEPGARVLFPCAEGARPDLALVLEARGHPVERIELYRVRPAPGVELDTEVDARVYTSPSAVAAAEDWERSAAGRRARATRVALGETTASALTVADLPFQRPRRGGRPGKADGPAPTLVEGVVRSIATLVPFETRS